MQLEPKNTLECEQPNPQGPRKLQWMCSQHFSNPCFQHRGSFFFFFFFLPFLFAHLAIDNSSGVAKNSTVLCDLSRHVNLVWLAFCVVCCWFACCLHLQLDLYFFKFCFILICFFSELKFVLFLLWKSTLGEKEKRRNWWARFVTKLRCVLDVVELVLLSIEDGGMNVLGLSTAKSWNWWLKQVNSDEQNKHKYKYKYKFKQKKSGSQTHLLLFVDVATKSWCRAKSKSRALKQRRKIKLKNQERHHRGWRENCRVRAASVAVAPSVIVVEVVSITGNLKWRILRSRN